MKKHLLWPCILAGSILLSLSCTKTVTQTKYVDSTVVQLDTVGNAYIQFVSMFPQTIATEINVYSDSAELTLFTTAGVPTRSYIPIPPDTSSVYYCNVPSLNWYRKPLAVTALRPTMNTYALFFVTDGSGDSSINLTRSIDSAKLTPPSSGKCYVRFMDGIADAPNPLYVELDSSKMGNSIFQSGGSPTSFSFTEISPYVLVSAQEHSVYVNDGTNDLKEISTQYDFIDGQYYTIRLTGWASTGVSIEVDQE